MYPLHLLNETNTLKSLATIRGDLSNITAPPFVLDTKSTVELPAFWAERPSVFVAPTKIEDPARRALSVLRWFISSLRNQQYAGHEPEDGVKKPLNAFLGEVFLAKWEDDAGTTRLVSEQVSHHPPVTACRVWNDDHGIYAEGFTRQEITFSGSINIKQTGRATLRLAKHNDETYLIPLPDIKISGILSGAPYPELSGKYYIPSTNGYISSIDFSGTSLFSSSSKKHTFEARVYREGHEKDPLFTVSGHWDLEFTIHDVKEAKDIETFDIVAAKSTHLVTDTLDDQDSWETRRAWKDVRDALERGDMQGTSDAKNVLEKGQREMRKQDGDDGASWPRIFFRDVGKDPVAEGLARKIRDDINPKDTEGIWMFNLDAWSKGIQKPYHGGLRPDNTHSTESRKDKEVDGAATAGTTKHADTEPPPERGSDQTREMEAVATKPQPQHPTQQRTEEVADIETGVGGMSVREQSAVEHMLRDRHLSTS